MYSSFPSFPLDFLGLGKKKINIKGTKWDEVSAVGPTPLPFPSAPCNNGIKYQE